MADKKTAVTKTNRNNQISRSDFNKSMTEAGSINDNMALAAIIERAEMVDTSELDEQTGEYYEFIEGETVVLFLKGIAPAALPSKKDPTQRVDGVSLVDKTGKEYINADTVMVSTAKRLAAQSKTPCMIKVFFEDMARSAAGEYKNLKIWSY